jgi:catechol 2,3-dioxygenase-like lactoylglutathione lyase family enzyme
VRGRYQLIGRFLELSVATPDIAASFEFYAGLGFTQADAGEVWPHPYVVVTDGRIHIGLHQGAHESPQITFVRPQLLQHIDALEKLGIELEFSRLGNNVFNEIGWRDPSGHLIRLVEARTFSPAGQAWSSPSSCGQFQQIALPTPDPDAAKAFWERLGFVGMDEPDARTRHICCVSDTVNIGLYAPKDVPVPTLIFEPNDAQAVRGGRKLTAPEGTAILLQSSPTA